MIQIYDERFFNPEGDFRRDDETLGFAFVPALIGAAPGIFQTIMGLFGGGRSAQFQGLAGINSGGQQLMQALGQIRAGIDSGQISPQQAVSEAQRIAATLNDPAIFYPARRGDDAAALQQFKQQAAAAVADIQQAAAARIAAMTQAGVDPVTGRPSPTAAAPATNTILLIALGVGGILLLTNRGNENG